MDNILLLTVDGGDGESFLGAFRSREKLNEAIQFEGTSEGSGRETGHLYSEPMIDADGIECIYLYVEGNEPWDYTLCFTIRETPIIG